MNFARICKLFCSLLFLFGGVAGSTPVASANDVISDARCVYLADAEAFVQDKTDGFDFGTSVDKRKDKSYYLSFNLPEGNYKVSLNIGNSKSNGNTTVRGENRRLFVDGLNTRKGEFKTVSFIVNRRTPYFGDNDSVRINPREYNIPTWDGKLTLEITGDNPVVNSVTVEPVTVPTIFLCGDSTVVDQTNEPWTSWGQIFPAFLDDGIAVSNHAESGESATSFIAKRRLDKVLEMAKPGDWMIIEFGHNDQKEKWAGAGAHYNFSTNLKVFIDRAREKGVNPVLVTPAARRSFDENGRIQNTHGDYIDAVKNVARRESVPLIDLNGMTRTLYETLGVEGSKKAFVHYPANHFPNQEKALADNTHFNPYGATQIAKCMAVGLRMMVPGIASHITLPEGYSPALPDDPEKFVWISAPFYDDEKPYGN